MTNDGYDDTVDHASEEDNDLLMLGDVNFDGLSPTDFEEFCFDLIQASGFRNVDWRKGTPRDASPADSGRDIEAEQIRNDVDGHEFTERWFVDCKHYSRGVPPDALSSSIAWATAERPATLLFVASGYFTNPAKDWIETFRRESRPPFRIRTWELPQLRLLLRNRLDIAFQHNVTTSTLRRVSDILAMEQELGDRLWYGRKPNSSEPLPEHMNDIPADLIAGMRKGQSLMEEQYGVEKLEADTASDFAWGMLSGKVSAIRWILGYEWDMLDS